MPPPLRPRCAFCNQLSRLNAEFYDQRIDLLDLSHIFFLLCSSYLNLLPFPAFLLPVSFLIYIYLRHGPLYKPPEPPPDMAIVRLEGTEPASGTAAIESSEIGEGAEGASARTAVGGSTGELVWFVTLSRQERNAEDEGGDDREKGFWSRMRELVDEMVDLRMPQPGLR